MKQRKGHTACGEGLGAIEGELASIPSSTSVSTLPPPLLMELIPSLQTFGRACRSVVYCTGRIGIHRLPSCPHRLTKSMETMVSAVEFLGWVSIMMEAGMSRVKLPGSKLITGGSVAMTCTMKGLDKM